MKNVLSIVIAFLQTGRKKLVEESEDMITKMKEKKSLDWKVLFVILHVLQRTLVIATVFVTKDFAVKSNFLLYRNLIWTRLKHE